jgi:pimeloyl-ACP methyl ester carboxylesterase
LIAGLTTTQQIWSPDLLRAVAATRKVVIFDNGGIGASYDSDGPGNLTITSYGESTLELIAALELDRPDVMGWSLGGFIALWMATNAGEAINHVLLASTGSLGKGFIPGSALFSEIFLLVEREGIPIPLAFLSLIRLRAMRPCAV